MQLGQLPTAPPLGHFRSGPSPVWPKSPAIGRNEDGSGGATGRSRSRIRDIINNNEMKQGFDTSNNNRNIGRGYIGGERKIEGRVVMAVKPNGSETTAMIRNIPNQYTREMLIKFLDEFCRIENQRLRPNHNRQPLAYDFLYLPIDFVSGANKGYAFVNFTHAIAVWKLHLACSNQPWSHCKSPKICKINYASIQGKERLEEHFGRSRFICNHDDYLPVCFSPPRDGSGASVAETTIGTRISSSSHPKN
ncbi:protein terminal ear1 homolog [Chenopodium quinoa]|uniref:protein terminal ear1 homolog n=1 Tax=Chenopodium quinoa TaxID=63459 RepID=UPI000B76C2CA|nr:protein terminal ear1 homolog [Chenopodium quinoa]